MGLREEFFPSHLDARAWATKVLRKLEPRLGCITLNRKIDSKSQRRLQCTAKLEALWALAGCPKPHTKVFRGLELPIQIDSSSREFKPKGG